MREKWKYKINIKFLGYNLGVGLVVIEKLGRDKTIKKIMRDKFILEREVTIGCRHEKRVI